MAHPRHSSHWGIYPGRGLFARRTRLGVHGWLAPGAYGFGILDVTLVGQVFGVKAGDFDVDVDAVQHWSADFLLVAGDGYGGIATFFDGGVVEAAGVPVRVAVATPILIRSFTFFLVLTRRSPHYVIL